MKRLLALVMAFLLVTLCGCNSVIPSRGTLEISADEVKYINVTNGLSGNEFIISDRESISSIITQLNSFLLDDHESSAPGYHYSLLLCDDRKNTVYSCSLTADHLIDNLMQYPADTKELLFLLQKLECDTMTDNQLIDMLLEGDTLEQLNIIEEEGKISIDKILSLPKNCPALFELISRPSAIASVSNYGADKINAFLNSANPELVEKAQEWIMILEKLMPEVREKLENLINNYKNPKNNP